MGQVEKDSISREHPEIDPQKRFSRIYHRKHLPANILPAQATAEETSGLEVVVSMSQGHDSVQLFHQPTTPHPHICDNTLKCLPYPMPVVMIIQLFIYTVTMFLPALGHLAIANSEEPSLCQLGAMLFF